MVVRGTVRDKYGQLLGKDWSTSGKTNGAAQQMAFAPQDNKSRYTSLGQTERYMSAYAHTVVPDPFKAPTLTFQTVNFPRYRLRSARSSDPVAASQLCVNSQRELGAA